MNQQSIIEHIKYLESQGALILFFDKAWVINEGELSWSLQPDMEFDYCRDVIGCVSRDNGLVFITVDTYSGYNTVMVFLESEEIKG